LHIWWMNHNSKLVTSYYINSCHPIGGKDSIDITQNDLGSKNHEIANCHTVTRQHLDPSLEGTLRHCCMDKKSMNVKPEAAWSTLLHNFTPAFKDMLNKG
ncbi:hypothetical protein B0H14DRAFT_2358710, partial [Mycena olivaceomarginata]